MSEFQLLDIRMAFESLITERDAMLAENEMRCHLQQTPAYGEKEFNNIRVEMDSLRERLRNL